MASALKSNLGCFDDLHIAAVPWPASRVLGQTITTVAFSQRLNVIATGCASGWVYLWKTSFECATERTLFVPYVVCVSESNGSGGVAYCHFVEWDTTVCIGASVPEILVTHHTDGMLRLWSVEEGRCFSTCATAAFLGGPAIFSALLPNSRFLVVASTLSIVVLDLWIQLPCAVLAFYPPGNYPPCLSKRDIRTASLTSVLRLTAASHIVQHNLIAVRGVSGCSNGTRSFSDLGAKILKASRYVADASLESLSTNSATVHADATRFKSSSAEVSPSTVVVQTSNGCVFLWDLTLHLSRWRENVQSNREAMKLQQSMKGKLEKLHNFSDFNSFGPSVYDSRFPENKISKGHVLIVEPVAAVELPDYRPGQRVESAGSNLSTAIGDESFLACLSHNAKHIVVYYGRRKPGGVRECNLARDASDNALSQSKSFGDLIPLTSFTQEPPGHHEAKDNNVLSPFMYTENLCVPGAFHTSKKSDCSHTTDSCTNNLNPILPLQEDKAPVGSRWLYLRLIRNVTWTFWGSLVHFAQKALNKRLDDVDNNEEVAHFDYQTPMSTFSMIMAFADDGRVFFYNPSVWLRCRRGKSKETAAVSPQKITQMFCIPWVYFTRLPPPLVLYGTPVSNCFPLLHFSSSLVDTFPMFRCCCFFISNVECPADQVHCAQFVYLKTHWKHLRSDSSLRISDIWAHKKHDASPLCWTAAHIAKKHVLITTTPSKNFTSLCLNVHELDQPMSSVQPDSHKAPESRNKDAVLTCDQQRQVSVHKLTSVAETGATVSLAAENNVTSGAAWACTKTTLRAFAAAKMQVTLQHATMRGPTLSSLSLEAEKSALRGRLHPGSEKRKSTVTEQTLRHSITALTVISGTIVVGGSLKGDFFWWSLPYLTLEGLIPKLHMSAITSVSNLLIVDHSRRSVSEHGMCVCSIDASHQLVIIELKRTPSLSGFANRSPLELQRRRRHAFSSNLPLVSSPGDFCKTNQKLDFVFQRDAVSRGNKNPPDSLQLPKHQYHSQRDKRDLHLSVSMHDYWTTYWTEMSGIKRFNTLKGSSAYSERVDAVALNCPRVFRFNRHPEVNLSCVGNVILDVTSATVITFSTNALYCFCMTSRTFVFKLDLMLWMMHIVYAASFAGFSRNTAIAGALPLLDLLSPYDGLPGSNALAGAVIEQQAADWWEWLHGFRDTLSGSPLFSTLTRTSCIPKEGLEEPSGSLRLTRSYLFNSVLWRCIATQNGASSVQLLSLAFGSVASTLSKAKILTCSSRRHRRVLTPLRLPLLMISLTQLFQELPRFHRCSILGQQHHDMVTKSNNTSAGQVCALRLTNSTKTFSETSSSQGPVLSSETATVKEQPLSLQEEDGEEKRLEVKNDDYCLNEYLKFPINILTSLLPRTLKDELLSCISSPALAAPFLTSSISNSRTVAPRWLLGIPGCYQEVSFLLPSTEFLQSQKNSAAYHHRVALSVASQSELNAPRSTRQRVLDLLLVAQSPSSDKFSQFLTRDVRESKADNSNAEECVERSRVSRHRDVRRSDEAHGTLLLDVSPVSRKVVLQDNRLCSLRVACRGRKRSVDSVSGGLRSDSGDVGLEPILQRARTWSPALTQRAQSKAAKRKKELVVSGHQHVWSSYASHYRRAQLSASSFSPKLMSSFEPQQWIWDIHVEEERWSSPVMSSYVSFLYMLSVQYVCSRIELESRTFHTVSEGSIDALTTNDAIAFCCCSSLHNVGCSLALALGFWGALMLHPTSGRLRHIGLLWCKRFCRHALGRELRTVVAAFSCLLRSAEKEQARRHCFEPNPTVKHTAPAFFASDDCVGNAVCFYDLCLSFFYAEPQQRRVVSSDVQSDHRSASAFTNFEFNLHHWSLLVLCVIAVERSETLKGVVGSHIGEPVALCIGRRLLATLGEPECCSSVLTTMLLELFRQGYCLIWHWTFIYCPKSAEMFTWQLWSTECAELAYAADYAAEQRAQSAAELQRCSQKHSAVLPSHHYKQQAFIKNGAASLQTPIESRSVALQNRNDILSSRSLWLIHQLLFRLFRLTQYPALASTAALAVLEIGRLDPLRFIRAMGFAARRLDQGAAFLNTALFVLTEFFLRYRVLASYFVSHIVDAIVKCLDPGHPSLRRHALGSATAALFQLVRVFPMVTFHQALQRFAVGNSDGFIIIYDLRTATKWRVLDAHSGRIHVIAFTSEGNQLASYSASDQTFCLWQCSSSGFFGGILGGSGKCQKLLRLPKPSGPRLLPIQDQLRLMRLEPRGPGHWILKREDGRAYAVHL